MKRLLCVFVLLGTVFPCFSEIQRVEIADLAVLTDIGLDDTANHKEAGFEQRGLVQRLAFNSGRIWTDNLPLGTTPKTDRQTFAEFDISGIRNSEYSVSLNFSRFFGITEALRNGAGAFGKQSTVEVLAYAGDGQINLSDWGLKSDLLFTTGTYQGSEHSQQYSIDITDWLKNIQSDFIGIRFKMSSRGGAYLFDTTHAALSTSADKSWLSRTPSPYLSLSNITQASAPSAFGMTILIALMYLFVRYFNTTTRHTN